MFELLKSIRARDPANPTFAEVLFGYNGYHAVCLHRVNSFIWGLGLLALARFGCNLTRFLTGVEIHPAAKIGKNLFIDHGMGVVIGQTAIIGDEVTIYQGVTLGGVGKDGDNGRRHPTISDGAIIGAGAQVLGGVTVGVGAKVGSNSVVITNVPDGATAVGVPARIAKLSSSNNAYGMPTAAEMEQFFDFHI